MIHKLYLILFFIVAAPIFAQESDSLFIKNKNGLIIEEIVKGSNEYNPLAPATAAFYSAVLPGLGQAYNKKYWKIPIIYGGMATGIYFYYINDKEYDRFRDAYKRRLAGFTDDEFWGDGAQPIISNDRLIDAQKTSQKNKDISILVTVAFYLVNIIDANVDAHLSQFNVSDDLSLKPAFNFNSINTQANYGLSLKYNIE